MERMEGCGPLIACASMALLLSCTSGVVVSDPLYSSMLSWNLQFCHCKGGLRHFDASLAVSILVTDQQMH